MIPSSLSSGAREIKVFRVAASLFMAALIALSVAGWIWNGSQPFPQQLGARAALALSVLASLGGLLAVWRSGFR